VRHSFLIEMRLPVAPLAEVPQQGGLYEDLRRLSGLSAELHQLADPHLLIDLHPLIAPHPPAKTRQNQRSRLDKLRLARQ